MPKGREQWGVPWEDYTPPELPTAETVLTNGKLDQEDHRKWADPEDPREIEAELCTRTTYSLDESGTRRLLKDGRFDDASHGVTSVERTPSHRSWAVDRTATRPEAQAWGCHTKVRRPRAYAADTSLDGQQHAPRVGQQRPIRSTNGLRTASHQVTGAPLNPKGRTGLRGRGPLGKWGPNLAADPVVTRYEPQSGRLQVLAHQRQFCALGHAVTGRPTFSPLSECLQVLAVERSDTDEWALPGGFVKLGASVAFENETQQKERTQQEERTAMKESFVNKAIQKGFTDDTKAKIDKLFEEGTDVHAGYVEDPRNTDNAWIESKVVHFHCSLARCGRVGGFTAPEVSSGWPGGSTCLFGGCGPVPTGLRCDSCGHTDFRLFTNRHPGARRGAAAQSQEGEEGAAPPC